MAKLITVSENLLKDILPHVKNTYSSSGDNKYRKKTFHCQQLSQMYHNSLPMPQRIFEKVHLLLPEGGNKQ